MRNGSGEIEIRPCRITQSNGPRARTVGSYHIRIPIPDHHHIRRVGCKLRHRLLHQSRSRLATVALPDAVRADEPRIDPRAAVRQERSYACVYCCHIGRRGLAQRNATLIGDYRYRHTGVVQTSNRRCRARKQRHLGRSDDVGPLVGTHVDGAVAIEQHQSRQPCGRVQAVSAVRPGHAQPSGRP